MKQSDYYVGFFYILLNNFFKELRFTFLTLYHLNRFSQYTLSKHIILAPTELLSVCTIFNISLIFAKPLYLYLYILCSDCVNSLLVISIKYRLPINHIRFWMILYLLYLNPIITVDFVEALRVNKN